jgi:hypothetical protein
MAVCTWDLLEENWNALGTWSDDDVGGISEISPAGQLYLDCYPSVNGDAAIRSKNIGSISGNYTVYMRFKGDRWSVRPSDQGIRLLIDGGSQRLYVMIGNDVTEYPN